MTSTDGKENEIPVLPLHAPRNLQKFRFKHFSLEVENKSKKGKIVALLSPLIYSPLFLSMALFPAMNGWGFLMRLTKSSTVPRQLGESG